jgi:hypothetical protein
VVVQSLDASIISTLAIEHAPKTNFNVVSIIDFSLAKTDIKTYFKQLKFAVEDFGFGVSAI